MPVVLSWNGFFAGVSRAVVATGCNFSICNCVRTRQDNDNWGRGSIGKGRKLGFLEKVAKEFDGGLVALAGLLC